MIPFELTLKQYTTVYMYMHFILVREGQRKEINNMYVRIIFVDIVNLFELKSE